MRLQFRFILNVLLAGVVLAACSGCGVGSLRDRREDRDPLVRRAREMANAGNVEGAVETYQRALDRRPQMARAHLELGLLYDRDLKDYVRAVYHYERYLEMRPNAQNRDMIKDVSAQARLSFATTLPDMPNGAIQEIDRLRRENAALREAVDRVSAPRAAASASTPAPAVAAAPAPAAASSDPSARAKPAESVAAPAAAVAQATTYVVVSGDTLSRIAGKVYGNTKKWRPIYDANKQALQGGPQSLKVGQTLIIPK